MHAAEELENMPTAPEYEPIDSRTMRMTAFAAAKLPLTW